MPAAWEWAAPEEVAWEWAPPEASAWEWAAPEEVACEWVPPEASALLKHRTMSDFAHVTRTGMNPGATDCGEEGGSDKS